VAFFIYVWATLNYIVMRKILLIVLLMPLFVTAQQNPKSDLPIDSITKKVTYTLVREIPGVKQRQLYLRAKEWVAINFNSAQNVIKLDDTSKLVIKAFSSYTQVVKKKVTDTKLWFTITISLKSSKYKFEVTDFETQLPGQEKEMAELFIQPSLKDLTWLEITPQIEKLGKGFTTSIAIAMTKNDDF
jgi:hypothetical protein